MTCHASPSGSRPRWLCYRLGPLVARPAAAAGPSVAEVRIGDARIANGTVHGGPITRRVVVDRRFGAATDGPTLVRLRAVDRTGSEHVGSRTVGPPATPTGTPAAATDRPPTATAATTPASSGGSPLPGTDSPALVVGAVAGMLSAVVGALVVLFR